MPPAPMMAPVLTSTSCWRKWLIVPDSIVKTIEARATASAVWMGTWKPTVSRAIVTPAPPAPTKPIKAPRASMEANSKKIILSDF